MNNYCARTLLMIVLGLTLFSLPVKGQVIINGVYYSGGSAREVKGTVVDSLTSEPIIGAVVSLVVEEWSDEKISVKGFSTNRRGEFVIRESLGKQARLEISYLGYKMKTVPLDSRSSNNILLGKIKLAEDTHEIDKVVVKARMEMFKVKGDTTFYFPKAVNTMKGDAAVEILRSMPGVQVLDSGEIVIGQDTVKRTYVNNRLIFGEDARSALKYLEADKVSVIQAYDEEDEESAIELGEDNAKKRKVINLLTFDSFDTSLNGSLNAGGGADFRRDIDGRRQLRYYGSLESNLFNERYQVQFSATARNMQNSIGGGDFYGMMGGGGFFSVTSGGGSGYNANENISLQVTAKSKDKKHEYGGGYNFRHSLSRSKEITRQEYFPDKDFESKILADTTSGGSRGGTHTVNARYTYKDLEKKTNGSLSANLSYSDNGSWSDATAFSSKDAEIQSHTVSNKTNSAKSLSTSANGYFMKRFGKHSLNANASFNASDGNSRGVEKKNSLIKPEKEYIVSDGDTGSLTGRGSMSYSYATEKAGTFGASYRMNYRNSSNHILAVDTLTNQINTIRSRQQTLNNLTNSVSANYNYSKNDKHRVSVSLAYDNTHMMRDNRFPETETMERTFHSFDPELYYSYKTDRFRLTTGASYNTDTPSLDMFSDKLDVTSDLWLRGGNPNLKQSGTMGTFVSANYTTKSQKVFSVYLSASRTDNDIVSRQIQFDKPTSLLEYGYDYEAKAGTTLITYANANHYYSFSMGPRFSAPLNFIKSNLMMAGSYSYSNPEEGVEDFIVRNQRHSGNLTVSLQSNFSSDVRINLSSSSSFTHFRNYEDKIDNYFSERLSADFRWDIFQRISLVLVYAYNYSINSSYPESALSAHTLNASVQCRVGKNRMGIISLNAFDILNNNSVFSSKVSTNFIETTWRQTYSSYFTLNFEYKFNRTK